MAPAAHSERKSVDHPPPARHAAGVAAAMSRAGPKPADDQVKLKKILDELTKREENKFCADCGCRGACGSIFPAGFRWVSPRFPLGDRR